MAATGGHYGTLDHMADHYVSSDRAAADVGVDPETLRRWVRAGKVTPTMRTAGGHYRWNVDDLRRQLADTPHEHEHQAAAPEPVPVKPGPGEPASAPPAAGDAAGRAYEGFRTARRRK
jgi:hypothetical protein